MAQIAPAMRYSFVNWNRYQILDDERVAEGGARAIHEVTFEDGEHVLSWYTVDRTSESCSACERGQCVQRVLCAEHWDSDLVIHDVGNELN
jgi:hypothetical protein